MLYDPIKDWLNRFAAKHPFFQRMFYALLDMLFLRSWYVRRELKWLIQQFPPEKPLRILDAGTGFGQYAYFLARTFPHVQVTAVDIKEDYLAQAQAFLRTTPFYERVQFQPADLTRLSLPQSYDIILSVDVMEHIEEDEAVFRNFFKVLKPEGFVLINTPSDLGGSDVHTEEEESFIGEHVREGYNRQALEEKLQRAGLIPVRSLYTYGKWGSKAWRLLIKWPMLLLNANKALALLLPLYYLPVLPIGLLFNWLDLHTENPEGTGLLVIARKPAPSLEHLAKNLSKHSKNPA